MKRFRNLKTTAKLLVGFAPLALITAAIGALALHDMSDLNANTISIYEDQYIQSLQLTWMRGLTHQIRSNMYAALALKRPDEVGQALARVETLKSELDKGKESSLAATREDEVRSVLQRYVTVSNEYEAYIDANVVRPLQAGNRESALQAAVSATSRFEDVVKALNETIGAKQAIAKRRFEESQRVYRSSYVAMSLLVIAGLAAAVALAARISRSIARPLQAAVGVLEAVADRDLTPRLRIDSRDEVGLMAKALDRAVEGMGDMLQEIGGNAVALTDASEELSAVSERMSANAEETSAQANLVSAASSQVSANVQSVATAVEELSASISEIAKNACDAARVAVSAVKSADTANTMIAKLGESSAEIGKVIKVITSIAQQTNLLALNATVEAARAGDAGRGFAVVASEVKELAKETAKATEDISRKIETIQSDTRGAVDAIGQISSIINQINDISNTIASAVEEQTATTNEIGRNMAEGARGSAEIAHNITGVAQAARCTTEEAVHTRQAGEELLRMATELRQLVARFKYEDAARIPASIPRRASPPSLAGALAAEPQAGNNGKHRRLAGHPAAHQDRDSLTLRG